MLQLKSSWDREIKEYEAGGKWTLLKFQPQERLDLFLPQLGDANRSTRSTERWVHARMPSDITSASPLSGGRQTWVMFRPAWKGTQGHLSLSQNILVGIIMHLWKLAILTSSARFWFISCIKFSSPALEKKRNRKNVTTWTHLEKAWNIHGLSFAVTNYLITKMIWKIQKTNLIAWKKKWGSIVDIKQRLISKYVTF